MIQISELDMDDRKVPRQPTVCVFCGARPGRDPAHLALAREFGGALAARGWSLVFGGGHVGMMGAVADAALAGGGRVVGVIPQRLLERELAHQALRRLEVVADMPVRKTRLIALADAFVALPGGFGTLDEIFEVITLGQLHYLSKPLALTGTGGFWSGLDAFAKTLLAQGFIGEQDWQRVGQFDGPDAVVKTLDWLASALPSSLEARIAGTADQPDDPAVFEPSQPS